MVRTWTRMSGGLLAAMLLFATPASAQVVQSLQVGVGGFFPRGLDSRADGDILVRNYFGVALETDPPTTDALAFEVKDFRSGHAFGEWLVALGPHVEVGASVGIYGRKVPTLYLDLVDPAGRDIDVDVQMRAVPILAQARFLPFGGFADVQPYVGFGVGAFRYRYSETGTFVDPETLDIFDDRFVATGWASGGSFVYGVRVPIGGDIYALSLEGRHYFGVGDTGGVEKNFVADKIDLGGATFNVGLLVRF